VTSTVQNTPTTEPADAPPGDVEVAFVKATSKKLRWLDSIGQQDDLRCYFYGGYPQSEPGVFLEDLDYYRSKVARTHEETQQNIPTGAYFSLVEIERTAYGRTITGVPDHVAGGKKVVMETIDPRDSNKRLQFRYWSTDEPTRTSFEKINNQMVILAIAAIGL